MSALHPLTFVFILIFVFCVGWSAALLWWRWRRGDSPRHYISEEMRQRIQDALKEPRR